MSGNGDYSINIKIKNQIITRPINGVSSQNFFRFSNITPTSQNFSLTIGGINIATFLETRDKEIEIYFTPNFKSEDPLEDYPTIPGAYTLMYEKFDYYRGLYLETTSVINYIDTIYGKYEY
jgi:hypothetical protein